ncbi:MAG: n-acetylglutamate synthase [candidate division Zixibacteria bacterium]|nr:n-acetylglutamate synthase [candidate division Zixibacteria bacterium]
MPKFDFNNRMFKGVENYTDGDLNPDTRFHYYQKGDAVWAISEGGGCAIGTLIAKMRDDGTLDMAWQYMNLKGEMFTGRCVSKPEILPDGRYRVREDWTIDGTDIKDWSVIEEIRE